MGTRESLPPPLRCNGISMDYPTEVNKSKSYWRVHLPIRRKENDVPQRYPTQLKRGGEKGEGSLSIPIVPLESREIRPRKAGE
jgi:hypothetical protein